MIGIKEYHGRNGEENEIEKDVREYLSSIIGKYQYKNSGKEEILQQDLYRFLKKRKKTEIEENICYLCYISNEDIQNFSIIETLLELVNNNAMDSNAIMEIIVQTNLYQYLKFLRKISKNEELFQSNTYKETIEKLPCKYRKANIEAWFQETKRKIEKKVMETLIEYEKFLYYNGYHGYPPGRSPLSNL